MAKNCAAHQTFAHNFTAFLRAETEVLCFLETFQRDLVFTLSQVGAFFLIEAESFQFSKEENYVPVIRTGHPSGRKGRNKEEAIRQVAAALVHAGNVAKATSMACWRASSKPQRSSAMYCYSTRHHRHPRSGAENGR